MPGPKPTPTAVLALRGSWRAATRPEEPQPEPVTDLEPPPILDGRALQLWETLLPRLTAAGMLTAADVPAFSRYVRIFAAWERAMLAVEQNADRGAVLTLAKLDELLRKLEGSFGLTPADRTGLKVEQPPVQNPKARFFETR